MKKICSTCKKFFPVTEKTCPICKNPNLIQFCSKCHKIVPNGTKVCPVCGNSNETDSAHPVSEMKTQKSTPKNKAKKPVLIVGFLALIIVLFTILFGKGFRFSNTSGVPEQYYVVGDNIEDDIMDSADRDQKNSLDSGNSEVTMGERNALDEANQYLNVMAFSYNGLIEQLEYSGYSNQEATYAAEHCNANWNAQAVRSAKQYLNVSAFSYNGLIEQLEYSGFSNQEATYAAEHCNANWNEQAAKSAKQYLDISGFSRDRLIEQLEYGGFTYEQAVYGVEANGY